MRLAPRTAAQIGICVQFAALIRCLAEYFRLKHALGPSLSTVLVEPFILGSLITAVLALTGVVFYFWDRYWAAVATGAANVAVLFALKFVFL
jgi:uncharacterized membrane protein